MGMPQLCCERLHVISLNVLWNFSSHVVSVLLSFMIPMQACHLFIYFYKFVLFSVADPGFPIGGAPSRWEGHRPPMRVLFSKNVCENKRIGSRGGEGEGGGSANGFICSFEFLLLDMFLKK